MVSHLYIFKQTKKSMALQPLFIRGWKQLSAYDLNVQVPPLVAQPLEASPCLQRMAPPHVPNIDVKSFVEVENDKGLIL